jgi:hypothetical protein
MPLDSARARQYLKDFNFKALFIEELGWDHYLSILDVFLDGHTYALTSIAQKRGMVVYIHAPKGDGVTPDYLTRRKIERQVSKSVHEHLIIYTDKNKKFQTWQWVKREAGKPTQCREHTYYSNQPGDALIQKLNTIAFSLAEEEGLTIVDVASRVRAGFDVDRVTKRFYDRFKSEHDTFLKFLEGIPDEEMQRWYASVMLNRLMFIYFVQKKGFLDNNINYLRDKLIETKKRGKDRFYKDFLCPLFFEGFAKKEHERKPAINQLLGRVPFLDGGIFQPHQLEELYGKSIHIVDAAFEKLFSFFDQYQWHLDERPLRADNEINPDVLGYIFEKYINQKQMGAYYTKEDITEYISKNTIIPYLFDEARTKCKIAFVGANSGSPDTSVWRLLQSDPDRYIYEAVKKGIDLPLPAEIGVGLNDVSKRTEWNKPAPEEYALPTEIWREVVARRQRYEEVRNKLINGEIQDINDFITYNLNIRQFAQDVIENCEGPELLRAFWHAIEEVTILDPTCGSGAFLFAALNILEPLYEACLDRMEVFLDELDRSREKHRPEKFSDFRKVLDQTKKHPNRRYFIFKSIIVNNLYGVDIMEEAIEICKLRLFLKLVAQIESVEDIEPLPDIDFNIRSGNTLVGYATYDEVRKAVLGDIQGKLDIGKDMERIDEKAQDVDRLFKLFREQQTQLGGEVTSADKQELLVRLKALEDELNRYLAGEYGIESNKKDAYKKWFTSHKPFHWFIEFYGIVQKKGGFDVAIGNPPYVAYSKIEKEYTVKDYQTEEANNLYALCVERTLSLLQNTTGFFSMIVPLSLSANDRLKNLRKLLMLRGRNWFAHFSSDTHPGTLFSGSQQNLCIFINCSFNNPIVYTTDFIRFADSIWERESLFPGKVNYFQSKPDLNEYRITKLGSVLQYKIYEKLLLRRMLAAYIEKSSKECVWYHDVVHYWCKCLLNPPFFKRAGESSSTSSHYKCLSLPAPYKVILPTILSCSTFYFWYILKSNCRDLIRADVVSFPIELDRLSPAEKERLEDLGEELSKNLQYNKVRVTYQKKNAEVIYDQYWPEKSKSIMDKIDKVLTKHYEFTDEELDFIINYDIKYRMGLGGKETEEEND